MTPIDHPRPCRFCLLDCWVLSDAGEAEHPCCAWWSTQGVVGCPACRASLQAQSQPRRPSSAPPPSRWTPPPNRQVVADTVASI